MSFLSNPTITPASTDTNQHKRLLPCRTCSQNICFDKNRVSKNGRLIPLNEDGSPHDCQNKQRNFGKTLQSEQQQQQAGAISASELMSQADRIIQDQKELRNEVRAGFEHVNQRLNYILNAVQKAQGRESS